MATICIMCDKPAGSREHVFPAAFGGRRMNKGIYCDEHNRGLGHHVAELLKVLGYFNASLGVRSDHYDEPKPHVLGLPEGQRYQLLLDNIEVAPPPPLSQTPELIGKKTTLAFSSVSQKDRWMTEQRKKGYQFLSAEVGEARTEYFSTPLHQHFEFGSEPFRAAVAYVALTLLAHHYPDLVRDDSLSSIRRCVLAEEPVGDRVWWVDPSRISIPADSSFQNAHSVMIDISRNGGNVTGVVSFFNHLCLAVDLGVVTPGTAQRLTILIDPLAQRPGRNKDVLEIRDDEPLDVPSLAEGRAYLQQVVSKQRPNPVQEILTELRDKHMRVLVHSLLPRLMAASETNSAERLHLVRTIVDEQGQRILNLLTHGIEMMLKELSGLPASTQAALKEAIVEDASTKHGLADKSMGYLTLAKAAVTAELIRLLSAGSLDEEALTLLFGDGLGIATATKPVVNSLIRSTIH